MDEPTAPCWAISATNIGTTTFMYFHALADSTHLDLPRFRELFGDPDTDYQEALDRDYDEGAPEGWSKNYVSYATMLAVGLFHRNTELFAVCGGRKRSTIR